MNPRVCSVLFICTGNSARSIVAEQLLNRDGRGRFRAFSAGSHPRGRVHPLALDLLRELNLPTDGLRSKGWDEFAAPGAPALDLVVTVCDQAAGEACPLGPGGPATLHWNIPDPTLVTGSDADQRAAFRQLHRDLEARIRPLVQLPVESLDRAQLRERLASLAPG